jgi:hypothetical protein
LFSSTPADGAANVPVDQNIVLNFSEPVRAGSGNIHLRNGDDLKIGVNDGSQVSINGNQVIINPSSNLNADDNYEVRIDRDAFTDAAGNRFDGLGGGALEFRTGSQSLQASTVDGASTFQVGGVSGGIEILSADLTLNADGKMWDGSANLGSDDKIALVGNAADVQDPSTAALAEALQAPSDSNAGSLQGTALANPTVFDPALALVDAQGGQVNITSFANIPVGVLTSQGLV